MQKKYKIAIVGITGAVGQNVLEVLEKLNFPISELKLLASKRSAGKILNTSWGDITIEEFSLEKSQDCDFVFLCVGGGFSAKYGKDITEKGAIVIDNSSHFRYDDDVPLVIPEINPGSISDSRLIANPNCTTSILAMALYPIYQKFGLKKVIVSTYQATSGGGQEAMDELEKQTRNHLEGKEVTCDKFSYPIPFNLIPAIDVFQDNGYTKEEMKVVWETRKIFSNSEMKISVTAVRIPTFRAHAEAVTIETEKPTSVEEIRSLIDDASGVDLLDEPEKDIYPMPLTVTKKYNVECGRIRKNNVFDDNKGIDFFVCGDQLLRWAALNAVLIAKWIIENK